MKFILFFLIIICLVIISFPQIRHLIKEKQQRKIRVLDYQKKHHLSDQDLALFKTTMGNLKEEILTLEKNINAVKELKEIETKESGLKSAKEIFQELMKEPQSLTEFDHFLYQKLPSAVEISGKIRQIKQNKIMTPEIQRSLTEILSTFQLVLQKITEDYEKIIAEDSKEIALTKTLLEKKHG